MAKKKVDSRLRVYRLVEDRPVYVRSYRKWGWLRRWLRRQSERDVLVRWISRFSGDVVWHRAAYDRYDLLTWTRLDEARTRQLEAQVDGKEG